MPTMSFEEGEVDFAAEEEASRFVISLVGLVQNILKHVKQINMFSSIMLFLCTFKACTSTCTTVPASNHGECAVAEAAAPTDFVVELRSHADWAEENLRKHSMKTAMPPDEVLHNYLNMGGGFEAPSPAHS